MAKEAVGPHGAECTGKPKVRSTREPDDEVMDWPAKIRIMEVEKASSINLEAMASNLIAMGSCRCFGLCFGMFPQNVLSTVLRSEGV